MIDQHIKLPCGAELIVSQEEPGAYLLIHLIGDRPLDKFVIFHPEKNSLTVGVDPDNLPILRGILNEATKSPKGKFARILDILRES